MEHDNQSNRSKSILERMRNNAREQALSPVCQQTSPGAVEELIHIAGGSLVIAMGQAEYRGLNNYCIPNVPTKAMYLFLQIAAKEGLFADSCADHARQNRQQLQHVLWQKSRRGLLEGAIREMKCKRQSQARDKEK